MKLYHGITSVCSIKVRVGLAELGLDYDEEILDLQNGDQQNPDYLKLNRNGVVPTLVDGDLMLVESSLILEYIDRTYNAGGLMPKTPALEAAARLWLLRCLDIHAAINTLTFSTVMRDRITASKTPEEIAASLAKMPNPVMRMKRKDLFDNGLGSGYVTEALVQLRRAFGDMDAALAQGDWVSGQDFGITDIALVSYIDRLERLGFQGLWADTPRVGTWLAAMQARPAVDKEMAGRIDAGGAAKMRAAGLRHWPTLEKAWRAL